MREITKKEKSLLLCTLNHIETKYGHLSYFGVNVEGDFTCPDKPLIDCLSFIFPSEDENYNIDIDQFLDIAPEILSLEVTLLQR